MRVPTGSATAPSRPSPIHSPAPDASGIGGAAGPQVADDTMTSPAPSVPTTPPSSFTWRALTVRLPSLFLICSLRMTVAMVMPASPTLIWVFGAGLASTAPTLPSFASASVLLPLTPSWVAVHTASTALTPTVPSAAWSSGRPTSAVVAFAVTAPEFSSRLASVAITPAVRMPGTAAFASVLVAGPAVLAAASGPTCTAGWPSSVTSTLTPYADPSPGAAEAGAAPASTEVATTAASRPPRRTRELFINWSSEFAEFPWSSRDGGADRPACLGSARESTIAKSGPNSTHNFPNHRIGYSATSFPLVAGTSPGRPSKFAVDTAEWPTKPHLRVEPRGVHDLRSPGVRSWNEESTPRGPSWP